MDAEGAKIDAKWALEAKKNRSLSRRSLSNQARSVTAHMQIAIMYT